MYSWLLQKLALPTVSRVTSSKFWDDYQEMLRADQAPLEQQKALQWQRLQSMLDHAYETVPFHRQRFDAAGIKPSDISSYEDLLRIPPSTKIDIQANFPDRVASSIGDQDAWRYVSTSGTANRLMVIQDFRKRDMVRASTTRSLALSGDYAVGKTIVEIPPDICNIVCGAEGESLDGVFPQIASMVKHRELTDPKAISSLRGRIERNWVFRKKTYQPFGPQGTNLTEEHMQGYVDSLLRDRPYLLKALPTYLFEIARYVERKGIEPLPVQVIKPMGASISPSMRDAIERSFTGQFREEYGSAEFGDMACDGPERDGLHVFMDLFLVEVVRDGKHAKDGELGRVLITDLMNKAMPLIRYDIGDIARMSPAPASAKRQGTRLWVEGRADDTLVTAEGQVFTSDKVMDFFYKRTDVDQFQLLETRPGKLDLLIVPSNGSVRGAGIEDELRGFLQSEVDVTLYEVKTIKPEASGKFRFVQSKSHDRLGHEVTHA